MRGTSFIRGHCALPRSIDSSLQSDDDLASTLKNFFFVDADGEAK
jgi:hypothetical protein